MSGTVTHPNMASKDTGKMDRHSIKGSPVLKIRQNLGRGGGHNPFKPHEIGSTAGWCFKKDGVPNEIRTRVATVKGWCPGPLDDGDPNKNDLSVMKEVSPDGFEPSTRTLKVYCSTN